MALWAFPKEGQRPPREVQFLLPCRCGSVCVPALRPCALTCVPSSCARRAPCCGPGHPASWRAWLHRLPLRGALRPHHPAEGGAAPGRPSPSHRPGTGGRGQLRPGGGAWSPRAGGHPHTRRWCRCVALRQRSTLLSASQRFPKVLCWFTFPFSCLSILRSSFNVHF